MAFLDRSLAFWKVGKFGKFAETLVELESYPVPTVRFTILAKFAQFFISFHNSS